MVKTVQFKGSLEVLRLAHESSSESRPLKKKCQNPSRKSARKRSRGYLQPRRIFRNSLRPFACFITFSCIVVPSIHACYFVEMRQNINGHKCWFSLPQLFLRLLSNNMYKFFTVTGDERVAAGGGVRRGWGWAGAGDKPGN